MAAVLPAGLYFCSKDELSLYDYSEKELEDYSRRLGIDCEFERYLCRLASRALVSEPPEPWRACREVSNLEHFEENDDNDDDSEDSEVERPMFFFNIKTGEPQQERPMAEWQREEVCRARAEQVTLPVTLYAQRDAHRKWLVYGLNMAGERICEAQVADPKGTTLWYLQLDLFKQLRPLLRDRGEPRFLLADASALGHSQRHRSVASVLSIDP